MALFYAASAHCGERSRPSQSPPSILARRHGGGDRARGGEWIAANVGFPTEARRRLSTITASMNRQQPHSAIFFAEHPEFDEFAVTPGLKFMNEVANVH